jgi:hypothetical protein
MLDVSENPVDRSVEGLPSASSSERRDEAGQAVPGTISTRDLIEPIFMKTVYIGVIVPFLFTYLGSSNVLAPYIEQSQWVVGRLASIWPSLPPQYELVLKMRGAGHAASFGFFCAALWIWPVVCAVAFLWEHARRANAVLPVSPKEVGQFIVVIPFAVLELVFDQTKVGNAFGFGADKWYLYLRQWILFSGTAIVSAILIYVIGRIVCSMTFAGSN